MEIIGVENNAINHPPTHPNHHCWYKPFPNGFLLRFYCFKLF